MSTRRVDLQEIADRFLAATGSTRPSSDAAALAQWCGYQVRPRRRRGAILDGDLLYYDTLASKAAQHLMIAEVVAAEALRREGRRVTRAATVRLAPLLIDLAG